MDTSTEEDQENSLKFIRKLRKKLRQIERLEKNQRELTDEEKIKLSCKYDIRTKLREMLSTINEADISIESNKADDDSEQEEKDVGSGDYEPVPPQQREHQEERIFSREEIIDVRSVSDARQDSETKPAKNEIQDKKEKVKKVQNIRSTLRRFWKNSAFRVSELEGHNDSINCVDALENWIISGSRDTTIKLWAADTGKELKSMGGHTGQIAAVKILSTKSSDLLRQNIERSTIEVFTDIEEKIGENEKIVISGSTDCSIRLWLLPRGLFIKSIYNYNSVSALAYHEGKQFVIVGSSSGNLTVYNLCSSAQVYSTTVHSSQITQIQIKDDQIITSTADGSLKVWKIEQNVALNTQSQPKKRNELEFNIVSQDFGISAQYNFDEHESYLSERHIHGFCEHNGNIYFGDDGTNIKVWNPSSGQLSKLRNHKPNVPGITDGLYIVENVLISPSYSIDSGVGSVNVRSLRSDCYGTYLASFSNDRIARLSTFTVQFSKDPKYLVSGGEKLLLWTFEEPGKSSGNDGANDLYTLKGQNVVELTKPPTDSDVPSEDESSAEEEEGRWFWQRSKPKSPEKTRWNDENQSQESEGESRDFSQDDSTMNKSSYSFWDWCAVL